MGLDEVSSNRPVNPMHLKEGISCFSMKWNNDWWGKGRAHFDTEPLLVPNCTDFAVISRDYCHRVLVAEQGGERNDD